MSTKAASPVQPSSPDSLEKKAYNSVAGVPTAEANDGYRLGYHVWRWLVDRKGTLESAVLESGARLSIPLESAVTRIREELIRQGLTVD